MENTNPQGSVETVSDAASFFLGMMDPEESKQDQPAGQSVEAQEETQEYEAQEEEQPEEEQQEQTETPKYRVKVDGEELEVELDELVKGYSRTSDYQRKTQSLAEQRKAVEAERAKIEEAARYRDIYAQRLQVLEQALQSPEEDLTALKDQDPIGYAVRMAEKMERDRQLAAVRAERQQIESQRQAEYQGRMSQVLSSEAERLKAAIPEFADKDKADNVRKELKEFAKTLGFSEEELSSVYDHRAIVALYKAAQYDKLVKGKAQTTKKVSEAPRMLKPGNTPPRNVNDEKTNKLRKQLANSGKKSDAAELFKQFL
jgi:hypothetical protein